MMALQSVLFISMLALISASNVVVEDFGIITTLDPEAEDLGGSHVTFAPETQDLGGSHVTLAPEAEDLIGSRKTFAPEAEDLGISHVTLVPETEDLGGSHKTFAPETQDLGGSHRTFAPEDENLGISHVTFAPEAEDLKPSAVPAEGLGTHSPELKNPFEVAFNKYMESKMTREDELALAAVAEQFLKEVREEPEPGSSVAPLDADDEEELKYLETLVGDLQNSNDPFPAGLIPEKADDFSAYQLLKSFQLLKRVFGDE
uniref:Secreted phosphoprotein 1 n=1 Tax=Panagrellus redivivus TaxID=6233 RepID=A0A7E4UPA6_PANRE